MMEIVRIPRSVVYPGDWPDPCFRLGQQVYTMSHTYLGVPVTGLRIRTVDDSDAVESISGPQKHWEYEVNWTWLTEDALSANPYSISVLGTDNYLFLDPDPELP